MTSDHFTPMDWINAMMRPRAFALADAPPDPELLALLQLGEAAAAVNPRLAVELSAITTPRVRALFSGETSFRTASGIRFTVDGSDIFAATVASGYLPESRDFEAFMQLVRAGGCVVDVGANFGLYALSAAIYARPRGRVFAFEPAPGAFALLQRNLAENDLAGVVTATQAAVGAAPGRAQFLIGNDVSFSSLHRTQRIDQNSNAVEVEVVSLDTALAQISSIDLLKIDVEGGEADVLRGGREVLKRSPSVIVQFELSHKNLDASRQRALADVIALLAQDGLRLYRHDTDGPIELPGPGEGFSGNLFLTRQGQGEARLRRAMQSVRVFAGAHERGGIALLQRVAEQSEALKRAEALQREVIEVADAVVGDGVVEGGTEAVRAVQRAWLDARRRAREAEGKADALSASVEGRDTMIEQNAEKIGNLRSAVLALEASTDRLREERERLIAKTAAQRESIAQLQKSLEESRKQTTEAAERSQHKSAVWRESDGKLRDRIASLEETLKSSAAKLANLRDANAQLKERIAGLEVSLKTSSGKLQAVRAANEELRQRLSQMMAQAKENAGELSRVRNVAKRMVQRYEELRAKVAAADAEGPLD